MRRSSAPAVRRAAKPPRPPTPATTSAIRRSVGVAACSCFRAFAVRRDIVAVLLSSPPAPMACYGTPAASDPQLPHVLANDRAVALHQLRGERRLGQHRI